MREDELAALIERLVTSISTNRADSRALSSRAFDLLVRPLAGDLMGKGAAILIPDKCLHRVPFGALLDSTTGEYLLARLPLGVSPSATAYLRLSERARHPGTGVSALVVAATSAGRADLPDIPAAREEAILVAALYPGARLLLGGADPLPSLQDALDGADIFHIAAHSVVSDEGWAIYLGPGAKDILRASDLELRRTRLVFLSSCRSAGGLISLSEGVLGPARLFLAAGATEVVASLWEVKDTSAVTLALRFHQDLRAGYGALAALRNAELALYRSGEPPAVWAAFEVLGGADKFMERSLEWVSP
jgi:CHAT domain-containing protein